MSDLVLRLAGDATVRGATTYDAKQVFSVYDSMALFVAKVNLTPERHGRA
jgi:hypothetical protein